MFLRDGGGTRLMMQGRRGDVGRGRGGGGGSLMEHKISQGHVASAPVSDREQQQQLTGI